jgi:hypothetical protein
MLKKFIETNGLSGVTGKIFEMNKNAGTSCRVLHNTLKDNKAIWLKYFNHGKNIIISI